MPLTDLRLPADDAPLPEGIVALIAEAEQRIEEFQLACRVPAFVPSDFAQAYRALRPLAETGLPGKLFCEWGSGFGVTACLAALLGFDACGIEIEPELVALSQRLAADFALPVRFVQGSFIPEVSRPDLRRRSSTGFAWLRTDGSDGWKQLGLDPTDFDVIFAYPWPGEEEVVTALFERHARLGTVLATYHETGTVRLRTRTPR